MPVQDPRSHSLQRSDVPKRFGSVVTDTGFPGGVDETSCSGWDRWWGTRRDGAAVTGTVITCPAPATAVAQFERPLGAPGWRSVPIQGAQRAEYRVDRWSRSFLLLRDNRWATLSAARDVRRPATYQQFKRLATRQAARLR